MAGKYRSLGTGFDRTFRNDLNANFEDVDTDISAQKSRVDNIVASAGNSNTEIVDARGTFPILKDRLDDTAMQLAQNADKVLSVKDPRFGVKGDTVLDNDGNYVSGTDDTASIKSVIAYAKANKIRSIKIPSGTYLINGDASNGNYLNYDGGLIIDFPLNIVMDSDTTLKIKTSSLNGYIGFNLKDCNNVSIIGGNIIGERKTHIGTTGSFGFGIFAKNVKNIVIDSVNISDCWGDGIYFEATTNYGYSSENVIIRNCVLNNNRRMGLTVADGNRILITKNKIMNTNGTAPQAGIDIEGSDVTKVNQLVIFDNYFDSNVGGEIMISNQVDGVKIIDNVFNIYYEGVNISPSHCTIENVLIQGNTFNGLSGAIRGVIVTPISGNGLNVSDNYLKNIKGASDSNAIQIINVPMTNAVIKGNTVKNCSMGIVVNGSQTVTGITISDNLIDTTTGNAIEGITTLLNAVITNNNITNCGGVGMRIRTQYASVIGNTITNVQQSGIYLYAASNSVVSDNVIHNFCQVAGGGGIYSDMSTSFNNLIKGNRFTVTSGSPYAVRISATPAGSPTIIEGNVAKYSTGNLISADGNCIVKYNFLGSLTETSDLLLTNTSLTSIVQFNPIIQSNFSVNVFYRVVTASTLVTITLTYTDGSGTTQSLTLVNTSQAVGAYSISTFINAKSTPGITINATAGTANQVYVSAIVKSV